MKFVVGDEDVVLTVEKDGVYGVKCLPHYGMGMMARASRRRTAAALQA